MADFSRSLAYQAVKKHNTRLLAALEQPSAGTISFGDSDVISLELTARNVAMVFQNYPLYPHMTARRNTPFGPSSSSDTSTTAIDDRVNDAATILDIEDLLDRKPGAKAEKRGKSLENPKQTTRVRATGVETALGPARAASPMPVGVDEAGKGPVFGSMFVAAVAVDTRATLPDGLADSKRLSPERRTTLSSALRDGEGIQVGVAEIPVSRIDAPETDMNTLTVEGHARAIERALESRERGRDAERSPTVICDACDTDADRFARRVADTTALTCTVDAAHGADDDDPLVGAASIIAKVERDAHVDALAAEYSEYGELGSGYPSDPTTRTFLADYVADTGELPPFARHSWSTCADVLAAAEQTSLEGF